MSSTSKQLLDQAKDIPRYPKTTLRCCWSYLLDLPSPRFGKQSPQPRPPGAAFSAAAALAARQPPGALGLVGVDQSLDGGEFELWSWQVTCFDLQTRLNMIELKHIKTNELWVKIK